MRELEKIVLVGLTKDEVSFIKRLVKKLHNHNLEVERERGFSDTASLAQRYYTGSILKKLSSFCIYSTKKKTLERDLYGRMKAYEQLSKSPSKKDIEELY